jgi:hypothetical protein
MNDEILVSGNLSEIRLPTLLMSLYRNQETGVLKVQGEQYSKALFIQEGNVLFASSTDPDDRLGETLLKRGIITVRQYLRSAELIRPGKRQGEILVEDGALTPEGLVEGVRQQVTDIIFSLILQEHGTYSLSMEEFSTFDMMTLSTEMPLLLLRGMALNERFSVLLQEVGPPETRMRLAASTPSFLPALELGSDAEHILSLCRHGSAVGNLLDSSYLNHFETYRHIWMFLTLGLIEKVGEGGGARRSAGDVVATAADIEELLERYNAIFSYVHRLLAEGTGNAEGLVSAAQGDLKAAFPDLLTSQEGLASYGRLDVDLCLLALRKVPENQRGTEVQGFLDELLYTMVFLADRNLDGPKRAAIHEHIRRETAHLGGY